MSRSGVNLAVTKDGGTYNKLRRPDDFLAALTAPPSSKEEPVSTTRTADSNKRKLDLQDDGEPESKRPKDVHIPNASFTLAKPLAADPRRIRRPVRDCGMQSMFPELDEEGSSDEAIDEVTKEALAYLRSVRSEASTIPKLLVATPEIPEDEPDRSIYNNSRGDYRAVYYDGTWVAVNLHSTRLPRDCRSKDADDLDPQKQYYSSLLRRYEVLRETLASANSRGLATLEADPSKYTDMKPPSSRKAWLRTFDQGFPTPARVAHISEYNLFCALESCAETLDRCETISRQKSCWIWTLLALAGEKGTLDYYRIGRIRDLGHKAGQLSVRLRSGVWQSPPSEDEDKEVEDWDVDGEGIDGKEEEEEEEQEEEDGAGSDSHTVENKNFGELPTKAEERHQGEEGEVNEQPNGTQSDAPFITQNGADSIAAQVDGADEREAAILPRAQKKNDSSDDSADMSMSEDEGVVREDNQTEVEDEATNVEEARVWLLAQLGDRLIQPSVPPPKGPRQGFHARDAPRQGGRHHYNGKIYKDSNCRVADRQCQEGHHRAAFKADQGRESPGLRPAAPPAQVYASRAEAEMQRQRMRQEELAKIKMNGSLMYGDTPATLPCEADGVIQASKPSEGLLQTQMNTSGGAEDAPELCKQLDIAETVTKAEKVEDSEAGKQHTDPVDLNTRVTIDMVLTVVAEYYGQKDLLRFREVW